MYLKHCKLSKKKQSRLIEHFLAGTTARTAAQLICIHRNSAIRYFRKLREKIVLKQKSRGQKFCGNVELDASYFEGKRKGKRAAGKVPVFGILNRGGKVYTQIISDTKKATLKSIIHQKIKLDSIVYADSYVAYHALDVSGFKHFRINHAELLADKSHYINGIENFWNQAKKHLRKYNGIPKKHFHLFLKECEWRFNFGPISNLKKDLKSILKEYY